MEATKSGMTKRRRPARGGRRAATLLGVLGVLGGCVPEHRMEPVRVANPNLGKMAIAVGPALNLSGTADFDPERVADLMASELGYVEDVLVIPVSRVLSVLALQGLGGVESPAHALELVRLLGADAILVFAVTEYDPYDPPSIGISAQLYGARTRAGVGALDPVAVSRQACLASKASPAARRGLLAQTQRVFDASHAFVVEEIQEFASRRSADRSPYGWRKYVVSQQDFIRFCCHATIQALLSEGDESKLADANRER